MTDNSLQAIGKDLWVVDCPFRLFGAEFGNRMTIIRYKEDDLLLHSPIPICENLIDQLRTLGQVKLLMAPNLMHNLFIADWKQRYPNSTLIAPKRIKKVNVDINLEEITREKNAIKKLPDSIHIHFIAGMKGLDEYILIHKPSKTLILTDIAFNIQRTNTPWSNIFFRLYGALGKFGPTHLIKAVIRDKKMFSLSIQSVLNHEFDKIIVSHGEIVRENGKSIFSDAFLEIQ
ncbi:MAG TPA: DUF4336 domain-containing protein [Gammaproteobacteria bacterium]|nr:DUF4336 domain-containing protein [Gammaproteobacteria bacterium]